jgi:hypothetical protein
MARDVTPSEMAEDDGEDQDEGTRLKHLIERSHTEPYITRDHYSPSIPSSNKWDASATEMLDLSISNSHFFLASAERPSDSGSTEHMLGCGPIDMKPGDEIVLLHGSKTPVVLRPEQSWWLLVGPAFSHALRDETILFISLSPESSTEIFEIQ